MVMFGLYCVSEVPFDQKICSDERNFPELALYETDLYVDVAGHASCPVVATRTFEEFQMFTWYLQLMWPACSVT